MITDYFILLAWALVILFGFKARPYQIYRQIAPQVEVTERQANFVGYPPIPANAVNIGPKPKACPRQVVVAVIDTGIDYTHPDFRGKFWANKGEIGRTPGQDNDGNGFAGDLIGWDFVHEVARPYDTHGHGTHVSGIILSASQAYSVGGCVPDVRIMPLKYYDNSGAGYNNLANTVRAFRYAIKMGANIINYSGGGADPNDNERVAIEDAGMHNILVIAAAGNDGMELNGSGYYPCAYHLPNLICVGSSNKYGNPLSFSNYGASVAVYAPGLMVLSELPDGRYGTMSGTSQATAVVSAAAALIWSRSLYPTIPYLRSEILGAAARHPLSGMKDYGKGIIFPDANQVLDQFHARRH